MLKGAEQLEELRREVRARQPRIGVALMADARVTAAYRAERYEFRSRADAIVQMLRLMWVTDAFLAQSVYRVKARLRALGVPLLPRLAHRLAMAIAGVSIGDGTVIEPGIYIVHGQVVVDGFVVIGSGVAIAPFVTIGLRAGDLIGPRVGRDVNIGTGAKVIGRVQIGEGACIGANSVVVSDVPAHATAMGAPARADNPAAAAEEPLAP
ncbi:MAG: hypothetical protein AUG48_06835 [Actinobacteria bacterium 13_1_20CM_3_68_9]|nr:MAG: hypothetical protein AUG48_06835 [Actinobacteria bacterium 13_1_20CM_3_68_9]